MFVYLLRISYSETLRVERLGETGPSRRAQVERFSATALALAAVLATVAKC